MEKVGAYGYPDGHSDCARCESDECKKGCNKSMPYSNLLFIFNLLKLIRCCL